MSAKRSTTKPLARNGQVPRRGRPTKYHPKMDEQVKALLAQGKTLEESAKGLGIHYATLDRWRADPSKASFCEAVTAGLALSRAWWDELGRTHLVGPDGKLNTTLYLAFRRNLHGWDRKEEREVTSEMLLEALHDVRGRFDFTEMASRLSRDTGGNGRD